ncbi:unnamed protein product [Owenia fusiformis]|uniref:Uncharacterized protein n=1 Tax=Owenia fusiformis TaxID=6347 RepID=A0A8S4N1P9_OWEFU|nr:unnamed protein product [Owenia fusiformis]
MMENLRSKNLDLLRKLQHGQQKLKLKLSPRSNKTTSRILNSDRRSNKNAPNTPASARRKLEALKKHHLHSSHHRKALSEDNNQKNLESSLLNAYESALAGSPDLRNFKAMSSTPKFDLRTKRITSPKFRIGVRHSPKIPFSKLSLKEKLKIEDENLVKVTPPRPTKPTIDTPKSILKKRKIIDDNIVVDSKFDHGDLSKSNRNKRGLNFSYSNIDDSVYIPPSRSTEKKRKVSPKKVHYQANSFPMTLRSRLEPDNHDDRLNDPGNDRSYSTMVRNLSQDPKSILLSTGVKTPKKTPNKVHFKNFRNSSQDCANSSHDVSRQHSFCSPANTSLTGSARRRSARLQQRDGQQPLLGYDFIAGMLDNTKTFSDFPDDYFENLKEFRRVNKEDCVSSARGSTSAPPAPEPISPDVEPLEHTCIHGYTVNKRLFTVPMNTNEEGKSRCPICNKERKDPNSESPAFVRISIPRSTLLTPYRVKPHRRKSYDPTDSCALSEHCLAGWECSKPSMLPRASTVDLRQAADGIKTKLSTTLLEAEILAKDSTKQYRVPIATPSPRNTMYDLRSNNSIITDDLLNTTHSLRYQMQRMEQDRKIRNKINQSRNHSMKL